MKYIVRSTSPVTFKSFRGLFFSIPLNQNTVTGRWATCDERQLENLSLPLFHTQICTYLTAANLDQSSVHRGSESNSHQSRKRCEKSYKLTNHRDIKLVLTKATKQCPPAVSKTLFYFRTTQEMETLRSLMKERVAIKYKNVILRASSTTEVVSTQQGRHFLCFYLHKNYLA